MDIIIDKQTMYQDLKRMLSCIFALPEITKVMIRNIEITSLEEKAKIQLNSTCSLV